MTIRKVDIDDTGQVVKHEVTPRYAPVSEEMWEAKKNDPCYRIETDEKRDERLTLQDEGAIGITSSRYVLAQDKHEELLGKDFAF